ncbi:catalase [Streptomyces sp. NPDC002205]|uniref:catalase n=1 Tax=Streptomyces sp. NPDC002205 TaxID=3154411 RepID=UPI0033238D5B
MLQDAYMIKKLAHFVRQRVPDHVDHVKGGGAFGYFEVTSDVTAWTETAFLSDVGKCTPVLGRCSSVAGKEPADVRAGDGPDRRTCGRGRRPAGRQMLAETASDSEGDPAMEYLDNLTQWHVKEYSCSFHKAQKILRLRINELSDSESWEAFERLSVCFHISDHSACTCNCGHA